MTRSLTQIDVLRYVYNETNKEMDEKIHQAILTNDDVADEFVQISEAKALLNKCEYKASEKTLQNILAYSKSQLKESAN